jgi:adenosylhomocysteinase
MDGFRVMPMVEAASIGDIFVSATGDHSVLNANHFNLMKDGAFLANSGHFDVEIDLAYLNDSAARIDRGITKNVDAYHLKNGRTIHILGEGRLVNLACAEGHPAQVMEPETGRDGHRDRYAHRRTEEVPIELAIGHVNL